MALGADGGLRKGWSPEGTSPREQPLNRDVADERRADLAALGWRALLAATLATMLTGTMAGVFARGDEVVFAAAIAH